MRAIANHDHEGGVARCAISIRHDKGLLNRFVHTSRCRDLATTDRQAERRTCLCIVACGSATARFCHLIERLVPAQNQAPCRRRLTSQYPSAARHTRVLFRRSSQRRYKARIPRLRHRRGHTRRLARDIIIIIIKFFNKKVVKRNFTNGKENGVQRILEDVNVGVGVVEFQLKRPRHPRRVIKHRIDT